VATAIVGAGFCGLGLAIRLKQEGRDDFVVFERAGEVGGTWRDNTYPGCACDIESTLYSYSFAQNPKWTRVYAPQAEIQDYLRRCVERFGIRPHLKFHHTVTGASWDEAAKLWTVTTSAGDYTAEELVLAPGPLSSPKIPDIAGLRGFLGKVFHSAEWDHAHDLKGKRVAVIGTGASAVQFIPQIQPLVKSLLVVQRTPAWVMPRADKPVPGWRKGRATQLLWRLRTYLLREFTGYIFRNPRLSFLSELLARRNLERAIKSPELRRRLTPQYTIGCKRTLISDDFYPALAQPNVTVAAAALTSATAHAIVLSDGTAHEIDTLIFATGFHVFDLPYAKNVLGRGGHSLTSAWAGSPSAHLGTTVAGFPNLFLLLGPNTGLGHSSILLMAEAQIEHIIKAMRYRRKARLAALAPTEAAQAAFVALVERGHRGGIWQAGGCHSWYQDATGRNAAIWPLSVGAFRRRVARFRSGDYEPTPGPASTPGPGAAR
jgi:cation diffusion facilitator CzcD-associated flavoprotein CzcO